MMNYHINEFIKVKEDEEDQKSSDSDPMGRDSQKESILAMDEKEFADTLAFSKRSETKLFEKKKKSGTERHINVGRIGEESYDGSETSDLEEEGDKMTDNKS